MIQNLVFLRKVTGTLNSFCELDGRMRSGSENRRCDLTKSPPGENYPVIDVRFLTGEVSCTR